MSILRHQVLVAELGLHGGEDVDYYKRIVNALQDTWRGWPKLGVKVQLWTDLDAPWGRRVQGMHGRPPLASLSAEGLGELAEHCRLAEIYLGVTVHDVGAAGIVVDTPSVGYVKIAGCQCRDTALLSAVRRTELPMVISMPQRLWASTPPMPGSGVIHLQAHNAYPANKPFVPIEGQLWGYSCHSVPSRAVTHCVEAAEQGARMIEVHVTAREASMRPMPGDYPVSLPVDDFVSLMGRVGAVWNASVL